MQEKHSSIDFHPEFFLIFPIFGIILLNTAYIHYWEIGILFGMAYFFLLLRAARRFFLKWISSLASLWYGMLFIVALISFSGAILYFFFDWNILVFAVMLLLPILCFLFSSKKYATTILHSPDEKSACVPIISKKEKFFHFSLYSILGSMFIILEGIIILFFVDAKTLKATNSPWNFIDHRVFFLFFLANFLLTYIVVRYPKNRWNLFFGGFHIFMILSLPLLVFPFGFGFDPFIHVATLKHILIHGVITPKPFYYLGSYAFILFLKNIFFLPLSWIYAWSFPILAAVLLPLGLSCAFEKKTFPLLTLPLILIFPFTLLTTHTPQAFASLILILFLLFLFGSEKKGLPKNIFFIFSLIILGSLLLIHPLSGIGAGIFFLIFTLKRTPLWFLGSSIFLLPGTFLFLGFWRGGIKWNPHWNIAFSQLLPQLGDRFNIFENSIYIFQKNIFWILFFGIALSFLFSKLTPDGVRKKSLKSFFIVGGSGMLVLTFIEFTSLIQYERENFGERILTMALYPLVLFFIYFILSLWEKNIFFLSKKIILLSTLFILSLLQLSAFYTSFPRKDHWTNSKLYNLSLADVKAIEFIENDAQNKTYIVLANQITSAGALQKFGFGRFLKTPTDELYFYPIPTSSPLYTFYLEMSQGNPSSEVIQKARELTGVNEVYMIFDSYWTNFQNQKKKIIPLAHLVEEIENGEAVVFKFNQY